MTVEYRAPDLVNYAQPGEPVAIQPANRPPAKSSRGLIAGLVVTSLIALASLALGTYFWFAADRWRADSQAWQAQARDHAASVVSLTAQLEAAQENVAAIQTNLDDATARITELANERAQLGDQQVADQGRINYERQINEAAARVTEALNLCTSRQNELIEALRNPGRYTEESVQRVGQQVQQFCAQASAANDALQRELNR